jgi:hypothetical protein
MTVLIERIEGPQGLERVELPNDQISRRMVAEVHAVIPGVSIRKRPSLLWCLGADEFCEFGIGAETYVAYEMYGDSDRYTFSPRPGSDARPLHGIASAFERFRPFPLDVPLVVLDAGVRGVVLLVCLATIPGLYGPPAFAFREMAPLLLSGPLVVAAVAVGRRLWVRAQARTVASGPLTMK